MKDGNRFLEELAQRRHEADKLLRLTTFKELMANLNRQELCPRCGADLKVWAETMGDEHRHFKDGE